MMDDKQIKELAVYLTTGEAEKKELKRVTANLKPDLTVQEAYLVQQEIVSMKLANGCKVVGPKMGLTSKVKMDQMGVNEPIYGYVFDYMLVNSGGELSLRDFIHPKVEAEIAFVIGNDIEGPGIIGAQVLANTEAVMPALEIIDSRYESFDFTLPDVIADNASAAKVVLGTSLVDPKKLELDLIGTTLSINGQLKDLGAGAAVLGHPANAVAMLANMLSRKNEKIRKGDIILSGALTGATLIKAGDVVSGKFDGLGEVTFTVKM